jgi:hypothetical protein
VLLSVHCMRVLTRRAQVFRIMDAKDGSLDGEINIGKTMMHMHT